MAKVPVCGPHNACTECRPERGRVPCRSAPLRSLTGRRLARRTTDLVHLAQGRGSPSVASVPVEAARDHVCSGHMFPSVTCPSTLPLAAKVRDGPRAAPPAGEALKCRRRFRSQLRSATRKCVMGFVAEFPEATSLATAARGITMRWPMWGTVGSTPSSTRRRTVVVEVRSTWAASRT